MIYKQSASKATATIENESNSRSITSPLSPLSLYSSPSNGFVELTLSPSETRKKALNNNYKYTDGNSTAQQKQNDFLFASKSLSEEFNTKLAHKSEKQISQNSISKHEKEQNLTIGSEEGLNRKNHTLDLHLDRLNYKKSQGESKDQIYVKTDDEHTDRLNLPPNYLKTSNLWNKPSTPRIVDFFTMPPPPDFLSSSSCSSIADEVGQLEAKSQVIRSQFSQYWRQVS